MGKITVLLTGVTGQVGGAVVEELLKYDNIQVKALVQTLQPPDERKAKLLQNLESKGVELYVGSPLRKESLKEAVKGVDVGISTLSGSTEITVDGQKNLIDALVEEKAKLFFPSGFGVFDKNITPEDNPAIFAKKGVNEYADQKGLKRIFLYTGIFYDWIYPTYYNKETNTFTYYGDKDTEFLSTYVPDIGKLIAAIVSKPERWDSLPSGFVESSEILSISKIEKYSKELGYDVKFENGGPLSGEFAKYQEALKKDAANFYGWFTHSLHALINEPKHQPGYTDVDKVPEVKLLPYKDFLKANNPTK